MSDLRVVTSQAVQRSHLTLLKNGLFFATPIVGSLLLFGYTKDVVSLLPLFLLALIIVLACPKYFVLFLPFLAALTGWHVQLSGINVRLEQALGSMLALAVLVHLGLGKIKWQKSKVNIFLFAFIGVNCLSSLLAQDPKSSLFQLVNVSSSIVIYFVIQAFIETRKEYERFFKAVLIAGFCAMTYGVALFVIGVLGIDVPGVNLDASEIAYGIYGSMREPNIFGSYSASMLMIGITLLSAGEQQTVTNNSFIRLLSVVAAFALLLSYARAAWVGAFCAILVLITYRKSWKQLLPTRLWATIVISMLLLALLFLSGIVPSEFYIYKIENLFNFEEGTGEWRALIWLKAWVNFLASPWLGNGTYSYAYFYAQESNVLDPGGENWISNLVLLILHDTGIIGMIVFIGLVAAILRENLTTIHKVPPSVYTYHAAAFQVGFIALLVAYQATSAFSLGFTWILIALVSLVRRFSDVELKAGG